MMETQGCACKGEPAGAHTVLATTRTMPDRSFSLHHGPRLPSPGAAPDLWGYLFPHSANRNGMLHSITSLFHQRFLQFGEAWISCAPCQQWDIHVLLAGQRSMGMSQGYLDKDSRHQCWQHCDQETLLGRAVVTTHLWLYSARTKATGIYCLVFPIDRP